MEGRDREEQQAAQTESRRASQDEEGQSQERQRNRQTQEGCKEKGDHQQAKARRDQGVADSEEHAGQEEDQFTKTHRSTTGHKEWPIQDSMDRTMATDTEANHVQSSLIEPYESNDNDSD